MNFKAADDKDLLITLVLNNPDISVKKIMQVYGLAKALEVVSNRELRGMLSKYKQRKWNQLIDEANEIIIPEIQSPFIKLRKYIKERAFSAIKA